MDDRRAANFYADIPAYQTNMVCCDGHSRQYQVMSDGTIAMTYNGRMSIISPFNEGVPNGDYLGMAGKAIQIMKARLGFEAQGCKVFNCHGFTEAIKILRASMAEWRQLDRHLWAR